MRRLACLLLAWCAAGCDPFSANVEPGGSPRPALNTAPSISMEALRAWPPLGKGDHILLHVGDPDGDLKSMGILFQWSLSVPLSGMQSSIPIPTEELGEGLRELRVVVEDHASGRTVFRQPGVLVDLNPPVVDLGESLLRKRGDPLSFWVADRWILGSIEMRAGELVLLEEYPKKIPSTLGKEWDQSWVVFSLDQLPAGSHEVTIVATDAAGNEATSVHDLVIDDTPPTVSLLEPASGLEVAGSVLLRATAEDDLDGPVDVEVFAEGAPLARLPGPEVSLTVDLTTYLPGPLSLRVVAVDAAGNRSPPAEVLVVVVAP